MPAAPNNPPDEPPYELFDPSPMSRMLNAAPSWIYLVSGLAILASALLVPAWLELDVIRARRDRLEQTLAACEAQVEAYRLVSQGLERRDAPLVSRLVARGLRSAPAGNVVAIPVVAPGNVRESPSLVDDAGGSFATSPPLDGLDPVLASAALTVPLDATGGLLSDRYGSSYLVRLAAGRNRMGLVIVGGIFVFVGLWRVCPQAEQTNRDRPPRLLVDRLRLAAERAELTDFRPIRGASAPSGPNRQRRKVRDSKSARRSYR